MRPSGAAYLVVAVVFIGLLAGLPSWAAKNSTHSTHGASAPAEAPSKGPAIDHAAGGHTASAHHEVLERGKHMYVQYCLSCHGDTGKGDGPGGANLTIKPQDLSVGAVMNPLPDAFLHRVIADGPQSVGLSSLMPPFKP
ncbi:MAG TPA: cytochrome c, partial [Methylomirabilota bacterium]